MKTSTHKAVLIAIAVLALASIGGCASTSGHDENLTGPAPAKSVGERVAKARKSVAAEARDRAPATPHADPTPTGAVRTLAYSAEDQACLERAMFFEANRSSHEGLVAVGTVVMNRVASGQFPDTVCGVVGQERQFAPGVLTRPMNSHALPDVQAAADAVLEGKRHPALKHAMFFHTVGIKFPYRNMHYVLVAGGNAFYERRNRKEPLERTTAPVTALRPDAAFGAPLRATETVAAPSDADSDHVSSYSAVAR